MSKDRPSDQSWCIELFLPIRKPGGEPVDSAYIQALEHELSDRFGGVTAYVRSPARGRWQDRGGETRSDDIVILEVMTGAVDHRWWADLRQRLERDLEQEEVLVRAHAIRHL